MSSAEPDPTFDAFLAQVGRALRRQPGESADVTDELRDHLAERLAELLERGVPRESAVQTAIDELGDAAGLAAEFNTVSHDLRRRWIMRYATASVAAAVLLLLVTAAFWPETRVAPSAPQATAQEGAPAKEAAATKAKASSKEENNARTEAVLSSHRTKADFVDVPLKDFLEYLREFKAGDGKQIELQIYVDPKKLEEAGVSQDAPIRLQLANVRLDMMLELVLKGLGLGYYVDDGIVIVTSQEAIESRLEVRVYNCRDLLQLARLNPRRAGGKAGHGDAGPGGGGGAPAGLSGSPAAGGFGPAGGGGLGGGSPIHLGEDVELIDVLRTNIKPESWKEEGGRGDVAEYRGMLVVTQTADVQRQIDQLLQMLRQTAAKEPPPGK